MVSKVNVVANHVEWIVDTGVSRHLCADREVFVEFEKAAEGEQVFMGNSSNSKVFGNW